jgi:hypothetical protein
MRRLSLMLLASLVLSACASSQVTEGTISWRSQEYFDRLPSNPVVAYPMHVRDAVLQEHGEETFVSQLDDDELIEFATLWCADEPSEFSSTIGDELDERGLDISPGREFLPPPPIDELMTRIADTHQPQLCEALGFSPPQPGSDAG